MPQQLNKMLIFLEGEIILYHCTKDWICTVRIYVCTHEVRISMSQ